MKTLTQHNNDRRREREAMTKLLNKAGVACDKCHAEMLLQQPGMINASNPPTQWVYCPKCGATGLLQS